MRMLRLGLFLAGSLLASQARSEEPTYENFGERFIVQYCASCHHSSRPEDDRHGAPLDVNFDNLEMIRNWIFEIYDVATGDEPTMPPSNGIWDWDRELLEEWILSEMAGQGIENLPPQEGLRDPMRGSQWYERMNMIVSKPRDFEDNERNIHILGLAKFTGKQNVLEEEVNIRRETDGTVYMTSHKQRKDGVRANPFVELVFDPE
ncbi:MAG: hypothetical protein KC917_15890, partial [Candidatus Omnitrophica bacterium]|nr:hypothetical protein [Candidatus Omnitrophota bacterium]